MTYFKMRKQLETLKPDVSVEGVRYEVYYMRAMEEWRLCDS